MIMILLQVHGNLNEDLNFEFVKKFLTFPREHQLDSCESITLGFYSSDKDSIDQDTIEMNKEGATLVLPKEEHAIYLDPQIRIDYITNQILRYINDENSILNCYFGAYNYSMRFSPFMQNIHIREGSIFIRYFYNQVKFELIMETDRNLNLELQSITIDAPNNEKVTLKDQFTLDMNSDQFSFLDLRGLIGEEGQEAVEYIKSQVALFSTFNNFLEKSGINEQTKEILSEGKLLLK